MSGSLLNYTVQGTGEPLLIIHGLFGSSRNWNTLAKQFARHFSVVLPDLRNHGDSFHADSMSYQQMAEDIIALMDELDIPSAHILGHSMGGKVAMKLTHMASLRVRRLIVADVAPVAYSHQYDEIIEPVLALDLTRIGNRKEVDSLLQNSIPDQRVRLFILQNLMFKQGVASWKLNWSAIRDNMSLITGFDDIADWSISTPSLFIRGDQSNYVSENGWELIAQHFSAVQLLTLENAGHWLHAEQPRAFISAVRAFLGG